LNTGERAVRAASDYLQFAYAAAQKFAEGE
jgi:hypothetical protein